MKTSPFKVILIFIVLIVTGLAMIPLLPFKLNPSGTLPGLSVNYSWQGADGRIIEQEITSVLEGAFSRVQGVKNIQSTSSSGWGNIYIEFDKTTHIDAARFEIATIIRQTYPSLPEGAGYPQIYMRKADDNSNRPLLSYTLNADAAPYLIQQYAENNIKNKLATIKGISNTAVYGASPMEWIMEYDADELKSLGITTSDIQGAVNAYLYANSGGLGCEFTPGKGTSVIHVNIRNHSPVDINFNEIPVAKRGNRIIRLKDIVTMKHVEQQPGSYFRINGANTINVVIYADKNENQVKLGKQVKEKIAAIEKELPAGYFILNSYDATEYIIKELNKNFVRTIATLVILLLFVLLASRQFRFLMLIAISLIANLCIAAIFYYILNLEMHLYSLAGITVSLGLIIDNCIMMIFHYRQQRNLHVFLASLAANLSTIGSLTVIFFMDERLRASLSDLAIIVIINLTVSLGVVLFFVPSLMDAMPLKIRNRLPRRRFLFFKRGPATKYRSVLFFNRVYYNVIQFTGRFRVAFFILAVLGFGLPVFMLPTKIENSENWFAKAYNNTLGSEWFNSSARPLTEKLLGGTLRLFVQHTFENSYYGNKEKTTLYIRPQMPPGATIEQMNELLMPLERYLKQFKEIEQFQSLVSSTSAQITIYFTEEADMSGFPFVLKEMAIREANDMAGADWDVYGVGDGFSNSLRETIGQNKINFMGYNFDDLYAIAEKIKSKLLETPRIKEVNILSEDTWFKNQSYEFVMGFDRELLANTKTNPYSVYYALQNYARNETPITSTIAGGQRENVKLVSRQSQTMDIWQVKQSPARIGRTMVRLNNVASTQKEPISLSISKENQQYKLILAYDYIGTYDMARYTQTKILEEVEPKLPLGYTIKGDSSYRYWDSKSKKQYWLLLLVITIIFFVCAVLFESLLLPFAVILMVPISYIGLFLTFYIFGLNFDQGGFAAFILLSGITVNAALYIINDYNNLRRKHKASALNQKKLYYKAFNYKIIPILLIILSTILGLVPFLWNGQKEVFWPAMAAGTIGGLIFSIVGIVFYLPMFLGIRRKREMGNE
ncbi:MAG TPA: efflux RND transporter permease subunit [Bacteroidales bacterium]|nr:efflux RND transporter permease subunit [Bacteroidales bacterium]